jgi:hypothetical protein
MQVVKWYLWGAMKRATKHGKEKANPAQQPAFKTREQEIGAFLAWTGLYNPLSIALAEGTVRPVPRRGRPRTNAERDAKILRMKDAEGYSFGQIAQKLHIPREHVSTAYYRLKGKPRQGVTKFP